MVFYRYRKSLRTTICADNQNSRSVILSFWTVFCVLTWFFFLQKYLINFENYFQSISFFENSDIIKSSSNQPKICWRRMHKRQDNKLAHSKMNAKNNERNSNFHHDHFRWSKRCMICIRLYEKLKKNLRWIEFIQIKRNLIAFLRWWHFDLFWFASSLLEQLALEHMHSTLPFSK